MGDTLGVNPTRLYVKNIGAKILLPNARRERREKMDKSQHGRKRQIESAPLPVQSFKMSVSDGKIEVQVAQATATIVTFEQAPHADHATVESITELHVPEGDG